MNATPASGARPSTRGTLYALALATFAIGTEGFMIAAILPTIGRSLSVSVAAVGQLVTVFALVYAIGSPVLTALLGSVERRSLLMGALGAFVLANLVAAAAPGYWSLAGARVLLALAAGLFVPNATALAGSLVPPAERGRALAVVNGGFTVAVALGVPLGAFVGTQFGWRSTFVAVAILASVALVILTLRLPRDIPVAPPASLARRLATARLPGMLSALATTLLWATGAYLVYTYVSPFLAMATGIGEEASGLLLFLLGASAVAGIAASGAATDRLHSVIVLKTVLPVLAAAFAGLTIVGTLLAPSAMVAIVPLIVLWGLAAWGFIPAQQHRLIGLAGPHDTPVVLSLNASAMYLGFSLGAAAGSVVIAAASIAWIGAGGAICVLAALATLPSARHSDPIPVERGA